MSLKKVLVGLLALVTLPILPVVFIWYLNIGGFYGMVREWRRQSAAAETVPRKRMAGARSPVPNTTTEAVAGERRDEEELVGAKQ